VPVAVLVADDEEPLLHPAAIKPTRAASTTARYRRFIGLS
jgi:hypothetical protein